MAFGQRDRRRAPVFVLVAFGLLLVGIVMMVRSLSARAQLNRRPPPPVSALLVPPQVPMDTGQMVVVAKDDIHGGETIYVEALELRSAQYIVGLHPELENPAHRTDRRQPLLQGYYEK
ncbi:MAG: hypothetical protein HYU66_28835, partial [Armatimonadetes bacterium]|nr:hypothetical protein [Armatimonadota bacterium]